MSDGIIILVGSSVLVCVFSGCSLNRSDTSCTYHVMGGWAHFFWRRNQNQPTTLDPYRPSIGSVLLSYEAEKTEIALALNIEFLNLLPIIISSPGSGTGTNMAYAYVAIHT